MLFTVLCLFEIDYKTDLNVKTGSNREYFYNFQLTDANSGMVFSVSLASDIYSDL